jgi:Replication-relaxation
MIFDWLDEEQTPEISKTDRMALILYDLGISDKAQIMRVTGWSKNQIDGAIQRLRKLSESEGGTPDDWVRFWQHRKGMPSVYSLGVRGIQHVRAIRGEYTKYRAVPLRGHVYHFMGLNDILVRLLDSGLEINTWLSSKEAASWLWHELVRREFKDGEMKVQPENLPLRPDAMFQIGNDPDDIFFVEYDCGTESLIRLEQKFHRYFDLGVMLDDATMKPLLFVTTTEKRREAAKRAYDRAVARYPDKAWGAVVWKEIYICVAGEEVAKVWEWLKMREGEEDGQA